MVCVERRLIEDVVAAKSKKFLVERLIPRWEALSSEGLTGEVVEDDISSDDDDDEEDDDDQGVFGDDLSYPSIANPSAVVASRRVAARTEIHKMREARRYWKDMVDEEENFKPDDQVPQPFTATKFPTFKQPRLEELPREEVLEAVLPTPPEEAPLFFGHKTDQPASRVVFNPMTDMEVDMTAVIVVDEETRAQFGRKWELALVKEINRNSKTLKVQWLELNDTTAEPVTATYKIWDHTKVSLDFDSVQYATYFQKRKKMFYKKDHPKVKAVFEMIEAGNPSQGEEQFAELADPNDEDD